MNGVKISKITKHFPDCLLTNEDLAKECPGYNPETTSKKVGIDQRFIVSENETVLDLAANACEKMFVSVDRQSIDFIILCTQSPVYKLPTTACLLQAKLGLKTSVGAFDINLGCSGYVYSLSVAKGLIMSGSAKKILVVTANTYSKYIDNNDFVNRSIFGDAATASLIEVSDEAKVLNFDFGTDGNGAKDLIVKNGGSKNKIDGTKGDHLYMNGPAVFNFTIDNTPITFNNVLGKNNMTMNDIDYVIFHQANKFMLNYLRKKIKCSKDKFYINLSETGNTISSTIPIALMDSLEKGYIKENDKVVLTAFGVGYSWSSVVIKI